MSRAPRLPLGDPDKIRPTFSRERAAMKRGVFPVAGCDEAGRGPLAGPVVAAAVILDPKRIPKGLNDSKKLNAETRAMLYEKICASAQVAIAIAPPARIDVDAVDAVDCECKAVISGDALVLSIAAASIVAKVTRDRLMGCLGAAHPGYGFERHMGYSVPEHFEALSRLGPCVHHRRKFAPVAALLGIEPAELDETALLSL